MKGTLLLFIALCLAVSISARSESLARLVKKWQPEEQAKGTRKEFGRKCYALTCAKSNKECGFLDMGNDVQSTGCHDYFGESCNVTESGAGYATGVCLSTLSAGARCNSENDRCTPGTSCQFSEAVPAPADDIYTCQNIAVRNSTAEPGESCGAFINCQYNNVGSFSTASECINGVCKFLANGETCTSRQCHSILSYCDSSSTTTSPVCRPLSAVNAACNTSTSVFNQCQKDLLCNPTSILSYEGECIEEYSIKEGKPCNSDNACKDGYCENKLHQAHFFGVCKDYRKTSTIGEKCADNNDCTSNNGESCVCNLDGESKCTNYNFDREQYKIISEYEDCEQDVRNNCGSSLNKEAYTKCVYDSCKKSVCKLYKDGKKHTGSYTSGNQACMLVQMCDASGLSLSLPLLAIVAVFVMLFQ